MRHRKAGVKLNRTTSHRQTMFRNMVTSLFKHDRIRTTDIKAKELRRWADHIITLAKRGDLHARRQVMDIMPEKSVVHKLFEEAVKRFGDIKGGYTRIVKIGRRPGDAAPISVIELVSTDGGVARKSKGKPGGKKKSAEATPKAAPAEAPSESAAKESVSEAAEQQKTDPITEAAPQVVQAPAQAAGDETSDKKED